MKRLLRYNPALLSDEELIDGFVVRNVDLKRLLEDVRNNTTAANQHVLVIAPRGMGKTTLVRRLALEVRNDPDLGQRWYPLLFGEETYEVGSTAELWLQALFHLGEQTNDPRWRTAYEELRGDSDDRRLRDRALAELLDFADASGRRILLVIENLHMLLGEQLDSDEAWALRKTLQTEPRLMLLATATSRFGAIDESPQALYGFFRPHALTSLGLEECREVWRSVSGLALDPARARPIQILTGGNVRLLAIVAAFAGKRSFRQLMEELVTLIDEHTTFFKAALEGLPTQERKVFVALAEEWRSATAKEVSERARVDVNTASSLLSRLVSRGAVEVNGQERRRKQYQIAERLFNIYYLLRRHGRAKSRVQGVVEFMVHFYAPTDLPRIAGDMASEALRFGDRREHYEALQSLLESPAAAECQQDLVRSVPDELFGLDDVPQTLRTWKALASRPEVDRLMSTAADHQKQGRHKDAEETCRRAIGMLRLTAHEVADLESLGYALVVLASLQARDERIDEEVLMLGEACTVFRKIPEDRRDWANLAKIINRKALAEAQLGRHEEAVRGHGEARDALAQVRAQERDWEVVGRVLHEQARALQRLGRSSEAVQGYTEAHAAKARAPAAQRDWVSIGITMRSLAALLIELGRREEALDAIGHAIRAQEQIPEADRDWAAVWHAHFLRALVQERLGHEREAASSYDDAKGALERVPEEQRNWGNMGGTLLNRAHTHEKLGRTDDALKGFMDAREALERDPADRRRWEWYARAVHERARMLFNQGHHEEALKGFSEAFDARERVSEERRDWVSYAGTAAWRAVTLRMLGRHGETLEWIAIALDGLRRVSDERVHDETARTHFLRAMTLDDLARHEEALGAFEDAIQAYSHVPDESRDWDALGRMHHGRAQKMEDVGQIEAALGGFDEALAAKSRVPVERRNWRTFGRTLGGRVRVRARLGRVADGLACLREAMSQVGTVLETREMLIDMFIDVAAADQAPEALGVLEAFPAFADLEPLVVALRIVSRAPHNAPKEIVEVAHDVVQRIEERRALWAMASHETRANAD